MDFEVILQFDVLDKLCIWINVGGFCYEMYMFMFKNILDIRFYWIVENYLIEGKWEYFYDCYLGVFM